MNKDNIWFDVDEVLPEFDKEVLVESKSWGLVVAVYTKVENEPKFLCHFGMDTDEMMVLPDVQCWCEIIPRDNK